MQLGPHPPDLVSYSSANVCTFVIYLKMRANTLLKDRKFLTKQSLQSVPKTGPTSIRVLVFVC